MSGKTNQDPKKDQPRSKERPTKIQRKANHHPTKNQESNRPEFVNLKPFLMS